MRRWVLLLEGCVGAVVAGRVTLDGKPPDLSALSIHFVGNDGTAVATVVRSDGSYRAGPLAAGARSPGENSFDIDLRP